MVFAREPVFPSYMAPSAHISLATPSTKVEIDMRVLMRSLAWRLEHVSGE